MNAEQMKSTLTALAKAFTSAGCNRAATEMLELADLFDGVGRGTVAKVLSKIEANWKEAARAGRHPSELKSTLVSIRDVFSASGAKTQAQDFTALLRLFHGAPDQSVDAFVSEARSATLSKKEEKTGSSKRRSPALNTEEVALIGQQLIDLKSNRVQFDALLEKCEREMTATSLKALACKFLGHELTVRKKADIIAAMRRRQRQDELDTDRGAAQAKVRP
jgi:hypothetical protein